MTPPRLRVRGRWPLPSAGPALVWALVWAAAVRGEPVFRGTAVPAAWDTERTLSIGELPSAAVDPSASATTNVGGGTFDLNDFLGADRYYGHAIPITGQNTIATNLEAGHFWNGHETLAHVASTPTNFVHASSTYGGTAIAPKYDRHATWAALFIGGRQTAVNPSVRQQGLAPGTDLRSAAIATGWSGSAYALSFGISLTTYYVAYVNTFGVADVINSSYGYEDPGGIYTETLLTDAMSWRSPYTLHVASAGNFGALGAGTVDAPGGGYNALAVAALSGANGFTSVAAFSGRGPETFAYYDEASNVVSVAGVRAAVDIAAPGATLTSAFYGGQNGGNNASLPGSVNLGSVPTAYDPSIDGTSFSSPIVAGGAALVASAAKTLPALASNANARQSVVTRALLLTGADKTTGWTNGQQIVTEGSATFVKTTQALDWAAGAGRMNLDTTFDIQVNGQTDVAGTNTGPLGAVAPRGWDYGYARRGVNNDYVIDATLSAGATFTTTLSWLRARDYAVVDNQLFLDEIAQADLNVSIWALGAGDAFTTLLARSASLYNTAEHLSFTLPGTGRYGLRVEYPLNTFDNTTGDVWGTAGVEQDYGLAWRVNPVPEPAAMVLATAAVGMLVVAGRRRRRCR